MKIEQIPVRTALKYLNNSEARDWQHSLERRSSKRKFNTGSQYHYCNQQEAEIRKQERIIHFSLLLENILKFTYYLLHKHRQTLNFVLEKRNTISLQFSNSEGSRKQEFPQFFSRVMTNSTVHSHMFNMPPTLNPNEFACNFLYFKCDYQLKNTGTSPDRNL